MSDADRGDQNERFASLLVVAMGLLTVAVVFEGQVATYAGLTVGVGLVIAAGLLRYRATNAAENEP